MSQGDWLLNTYAGVEQLLPLGRDEVEHPVDGAGQRHPADEQRYQHHVREQRREVRHLQRHFSEATVGNKHVALYTYSSVSKIVRHTGKLPQEICFKIERSTTIIPIILMCLTKINFAICKKILFGQYSKLPAESYENLDT